MVEENLSCSFCTKPKDEAKQLISGQNEESGVCVYICDECVDLCSKIIHKK